MLWIKRLMAMPLYISRLSLYCGLLYIDGQLLIDCESIESAVILKVLTSLNSIPVRPGKDTAV